MVAKCEHCGPTRAEVDPLIATGRASLIPPSWGGIKEEIRDVVVRNGPD